MPDHTDNLNRERRTVYEFDEAQVPVPLPSALTLPFWEGCKRGELCVPTCRTCGTRFFPPEERCTACLCADWQWRRSAGRGSVYSFTVVEESFWTRNMGMTTPYVVAIVELDDGFSMLTNVVKPFDKLRIGAPVEVVFEPLTAEITLPRFRVVTQPSEGL